VGTRSGTPVQLQPAFSQHQQDDSRHHFALELFASPQVYAVTDQLSEDWVSDKLSAIKDDIFDRMGEEGSVERAEWRTAGWQSGCPGREHQKWELFLEGDDEPYAMTVLQLV
jgi:hypothetical protein